ANIRDSLSDLPKREIKSTWGRIWVEVKDDLPDVLERITKVFGIYSVSPVLETSKDIEEISKTALQVLLSALPEGGTFKVETKRSDKTFPLTSPEVSQQVAGKIFDVIDDKWDADMHHPQRTINIEIRGEGAYVYGETMPCAKGLPVGCGGKAVLLLSGGIDSPVAGWMALKRGVALEAVHFHSFPFTGEKSKEKVVDLCRLLAKWQGRPIKLHVVHFTDIQKAIRKNCPEEYGITIMRRMMFRIGQKIARQRKALALYTGESVGQVASQTLESINTINAVVDIPVLRPLIGMDKEDIIKYAQHIGSFETSILPYEDCCTLFLPAFHKIRPTIAEALEYEEALDIDVLIAEALSKTEILSIK
ncbi:MAG: tRNA uracil 4-sulfurtransferase ThiI, partial [Clostridiales bacterium]